jgi:hypothetical protein
MARLGIAPTDPPRFAFLVNHLVGEREGAWAEAADLLATTLGDNTHVGVLRHRAVAESFAGAPVSALALIPAIAEAGDTTARVAALAVHMGVLQFAAPDEPVLQLTHAFGAVLGELQFETGRLGRLGAMLAANLNNVTARLLDAEDAPLEDEAYRHTLTEGARLARLAWTAAGTWINRERADHLVALCANLLRAYEDAQKAALSGLRTIDENGSEDVDRAFLLVELSRAQRGLDKIGESEQSRAAALRLAAEFDKDTRAWFDARAAA